MRGFQFTVITECEDDVSDQSIVDTVSCILLAENGPDFSVTASDGHRLDQDVAEEARKALITA